MFLAPTIERNSSSKDELLAVWNQAGLLPTITLC
jgi:hypothetical protein